MSNDTNNNVDLDICSPQLCNDFGTCRILNAGKSTEWYECICDLWHSGQKCEFQVPLPIVVTLTCTFFACAILFFCWCSSYRFSKRKIHMPQDRRRFVDHLHKHQKFEKHWLRTKIEEENKRTGKTRDIPFDEQTDQEPEVEKKEKKKEEKKEEVEEEVPKRPEPSRERDMQKLKEEETVQKLKEKLKREQVADEQDFSKIDVSTKSTASTKSTTSTTSTSGGLRELSGVASNTTNALPEDAPIDNKVAHAKKKKREAQQEKWAEQQSVEANKKKKK